ncbi:MAG: hypothetical protein ACHP84_03700 [Caulobacterales bacterium]
MVAADIEQSPAVALVARLTRLANPQSLVDARLAIAREVAAQAAMKEPITAALVVGSTALGRCSAGADLDLVLVTPALSARATFETQTVRGVRVEIERMGQSQALAVTDGEGWIWELRQAARLACGVAVHDPQGFATRLAQRAASMRPWSSRCEAALRDVYVSVAELGLAGGDPFRRAEVVRGCLDNLVVLALLERPRRYQKAKWALADLLHAGETDLVNAVLRAYGAVLDSTSSARQAIAAARALVEAVLRHCRAPSHDALIDMGYAPQFAEASYVSRCLADAEDLASSGRLLEAQYVARFAGRLAAGLTSPKHGAPSILGTFEQTDPAIAALYVALLGGVAEPGSEIVDIILNSADARAKFLETGSSPIEVAR